MHSALVFPDSYRNPTVGSDRESQLFWRTFRVCTKRGCVVGGDLFPRHKMLVDTDESPYATLFDYVSAAHQLFRARC